MDGWVLKRCDNVAGYYLIPLRGHVFLYKFHGLCFFCVQLTCGICFENYPRSGIEMASCGHPYCFSCWEGMSCILFPSSFVNSDQIWALS